MVKQPRKSAPGLDGLLAWAHEQGASRVSFQSNHRVTIDVHAQTRLVTAERIDDLTISEIANHLYGAEGSARLENGHPFDVAYSVRAPGARLLRFRVNATPSTTRRGVGANLVLRPIPDMPPSLEQQTVEPVILQAFRPDSGMIFVGGSTGSGKSTLIAGTILDKVLRPSGRCHVATGEQPIEFLLEHVVGPQGQSINQHDIPGNLGGFAEFIRGCVRRELTDIVVGECRETETMVAAINAAMVGNVLTTTIHADDVPLMMMRAQSLCPPGERDNLISALAQAMRLCVNQRLLPRVGGGRVAVREFLVFDRALRLELLQNDTRAWLSILTRAIAEQGQSYAIGIGKAHASGLITAETAARALRRDA